MKDLLDKLSPYNVFNYLLPGVVFAVFLDTFTAYSVIQASTRVTSSQFTLTTGSVGG